MRWLLLILLLNGCTREPKPVSFYYWKTKFRLSEFEKKILKEEGVQDLYVRFFDVDTAGPMAPIDMENVKGYNSVPVIYIKNRSFEQLDSAGVIKLAENVHRFIKGPYQEIQFDCDWTESTRDKYFQFLTQYRAIAHQSLSATIRLHQVKYKIRTGVPPVDRGVLMYYNMAGINPDDVNSIYDKSVASRYSDWIKSYPLPLDAALPIFSWAYSYRDGKVVKLLNKLNFTYFQNDSTFIPAGNNKLVAKQACFKAGYYFHQNDTIKLEHVPAADLVDIAKKISAGRSIGKVIFFDLDSSNIVQYEKDIFKKVLDIIY